jgi:hypothetical protein
MSWSPNSLGEVLKGPRGISLWNFEDCRNGYGWWHVVYARRTFLVDSSVSTGDFFKVFEAFAVRNYLPGVNNPTAFWITKFHVICFSKAMTT